MMQQKLSVETKELQQAMATCDLLFTKMTDSYQHLEARFQRLSQHLVEQTDAKRGAAELLSADRLAAIIHALPGGVVILDGSGAIVQCNPAAEDMLGIPLRGEKWFNIIARAFAPKADDGHDISLKDGRLVNISTQPLGSHPGQVILLHDVTRTRELQNEQMRNKRLAALGEMAASLAHQLRTPLSSALLYSAHLKNSHLDDARKQAMTDKVITQIKHLEQLINDMLVFAKGGCVGEDVISLNELANALQQQGEELLAASEVRFTLVNQMPDSWLVGNKQLLQSALLNLIDNANQAMTGKGTLTITFRPAAGGVDILVSDDGPGIAKSQQERIFEPFFTTRSSGTGLGLAVVRVVAQAHHGEAWVESDEGRGCTVGLRLPARETNACQSSYNGGAR